MKGHSYNPEGCPKCGKVHIPPFQGKHHTEENKKIFGPKISRASRGKKKPEGFGRKVSKSLTGRPKPKSFCKKKSEQQRGVSLSERGHRSDCGCCICKAKRGETKGVNNSFYGKHHSQGTIANLSQGACIRLSFGFGKVRGWFYSAKNGRTFHYRSSWELFYMRILEEDKDVLSYGYETVRVPYLDAVGSKRFVVPDFLVNLVDGTKLVVEVRPVWRLNYKNTRMTMDVVASFCKQKGYKFVWINDFLSEENFKQIRLVD